MKLLSNTQSFFTRSMQRGSQKVLKNERKLKSSRINSRLFFTLLFWSALIGIISLSILSWYRTGFLNHKVNAFQKTAATHASGINDSSFITSPAAESHSSEFLTVFLNIPSDEKEREARVNALKGYLAEGLPVEALENTSSFHGKRVLKSASLYDIKDKSETAASFVYRVEYELFKSEEKKKGEPAKETSIGRKEQLIVVPLATDGRGFNVVEQPYYEALPSETRLLAISDHTDQSEKNSGAEEELKRFASQFFTSYTKSSEEEMSYFMKKPETLNGLYTYKGMDKFVVYDGKRDGEYVIKTLLLLEEKESGLISKHPYTLTVKKENDRFFVEELKHSLGG
ncbi:conjugal transfer protein [Niallia sp. 03133]|uniref:conjugal transfer protein n=1 Tax=Niallia sp. 03133 TaxID=3458060 RepID=UPI00404424F9